jgi:hypothetical protein
MDEISSGKTSLLLGQEDRAEIIRLYGTLTEDERRQADRFLRLVVSSRGKHDAEIQTAKNTGFLFKVLNALANRWEAEEAAQ